MPRHAFADVEAGHRLLEGFLLRLARQEDAETFVLRGGMLVRRWFPRVGRPAKDIDLVCGLPFDAKAVRYRLAAILSDRRVEDGVVFDAERFRLDTRCTSTPHPGMRLFVAGQADGHFSQISVDVTFHLDVWPAAERTPDGLWACQPQMLVGRKLQVTADLGRHHWRPKDLADFFLMLRHHPTSVGVLGEAIERSFAGETTTNALDDVLSSPAWWQDHRAHTRWARFARAVPGVPNELGPVVSEVRSRLAPFVRST